MECLAKVLTPDILYSDCYCCSRAQPLRKDRSNEEEEYGEQENEHPAELQPPDPPHLEPEQKLHAPDWPTLVAQVWKGKKVICKLDVRHAEERLTGRKCCHQKHPYFRGFAALVADAFLMFDKSDVPLFFNPTDATKPRTEHVLQNCDVSVC